MITIAISTYNRLSQLSQCLTSIDSTQVDEILIFNDDEKNKLNLKNISLENSIVDYINIYEPSNFKFYDRKFRKPFYINKALEIAKNKSVLISDDDVIFHKGCIDKHINALLKYPFCSGGIIKNNIIGKVSASILQGTNYSINKELFNDINGYDEFFMDTNGGGDFDFWYRLYQFSKKTDTKLAYIPTAIQKVSGKSVRKKNFSNKTKAKEYTLEKHSLNLTGPMYKWCPQIRNKKTWMDVIDDK